MHDEKYIEIELEEDESPCDLCTAQGTPECPSKCGYSKFCFVGNGGY